MKRFLAICLLFFGGAPPTSAARAGEVTGAPPRWVEKTLRSMSLDEKIGQMIMPGYEVGSFRNVDSDEFVKVRRNIVEFHVGGVHVYGGDPTPVALAINEMQKLAKVPLLISDNFEGGVGYVLFGATRLPLAMAIGATGDERLAYEAAKVTAQEGRAIGVNVNFYPVADVQNNPENPIINIRAFGEDPATVSRFVRAYIRGAQENGQMATAKHFPGHGDVASDSHLEMPVLNVPAQRLESVELPPFRAAVDQGVAAFMSAHIWLPQIEPEKGLPSTLSKNVMTGILRDELHYDGIVFTDAMTMRGVSANFKNDDATLRAVEAGADIILIPPSVEDSFRAIKSALESGRLTESRIDVSVRRILRAKARFDLANPKNRFVDVYRLMTVLGTRENRDFAQRIADNAITLVRDERQVLPLRPSPDLRVVQINLLDTRTGWREGVSGRLAAAELPKRFPRAVTVQVDDQSTPTELDLVRKLAQTGDAIVVNGYIRVAAYKGSIALTPAEIALLRDLAAMKKPFVLTVFGSPYVLTHIPEMPSYIVTYDTSPLAEMAMVRAITGEIEFKGKLPISLPGLYPIGHGLTAK
ncbi:MAG TPA: glycoside hydrolase family 3 N-terminal domain-containing protein [Thermoanaerobaculia bacterium]|nr:glycoside hydrolase family 3 N-terminal domain-containing protein [Thermoanaerobaculia bacterium]